MLANPKPSASRFDGWLLYRARAEDIGIGDSGSAELFERTTQHGG